MTTYRQAADAGFQTLVKLWNKAAPFKADNGGCFWMCGNTFHVAIDYLRQTNQKDTYGLANDALALFDLKITDKDPKNWVNDETWVDDYGWWGTALAGAYLSADTLGYDAAMKNRLEQYTKNCWTGMKYAWDPSQIKGTNISGGIWNSRKSNSYLAGRNCVTNEVYWEMSLYCTYAFGSGYLNLDTDEALWFAQALRGKILFLSDSQKLVLERFAGTGGVPGYTWLGDQGLFAYCCFRNGDPMAKELDRALAGTIVQAVQTNRTVNHILSEPLFSDSEFILDYAGGKGVFIRNLAIIQEDHEHEPGTRYDDFLKANGAAVWNNQLADGKFHYWWEKSDDGNIDWKYPQNVADAVLHASGMSALNACLSFAADQAIPAKAKEVGVIAR